MPHPLLKAKASQLSRRIGTTRGQCIRVFTSSKTSTYLTPGIRKSTPVGAVTVTYNNSTAKRGSRPPQRTNSMCDGDGVEKSPDSCGPVSVTQCGQQRSQHLPLSGRISQQVIVGASMLKHLAYLRTRAASPYKTGTVCAGANVHSSVSMAVTTRC